MKSGRKDVKLNPQDLSIFLASTRDMNLTPLEMQTILTKLDDEKVKPDDVLSQGVIERHLQRYKMTEQQIRNRNAKNAQTRRNFEAMHRRMYGNSAVDKMKKESLIGEGGRRKRTHKRTLRKHKRTLRKHKRNHRRTHRR
jgi:hypothetical protein